jgi:hypothetical protein
MWCVAPLEMDEGNSLWQVYNRPTGCSAERPHRRPFYAMEENSLSASGLISTPILVLHCLFIYRSYRKARFKASVYSRSLAGAVGPNPAGGIDVYSL